MRARGGTQAEILGQAAAALLDHRVEGEPVAVLVEGVDQVEPGGGRAFEGAALEPELMLDLGADEDVVGDHVPVEHDVAGTGQGERPALRVVHEAAREGAAREGVLHHREADEHDHEHEAADEGRRHEIGGQLAHDGEAGRRDPGHQEEPGGNEHHGAVVAVRRQMDHEDEADAGDRRDRHARHARGHRRIDDGERHEGAEEEKPEGRHVAVAHVPAIEVEIGEEEDEKGRG